MNEAVRVPSERVQDCDFTGPLLLSEHVVSVPANPKPEMWTVEPGKVEGVSSVIEGGT